MLNKKPYTYLWIGIPPVLLIGFLGWDKTVDIQMHDTYLVLGKIYIALVISIALGILGSISFILEKVHHNGILSLLHALFSLVSFLGIVLLMSFTDYIIMPFSFDLIGTYFWLLIILFFLAQVLLLSQILLFFIMIWMK